MTTDISLLAELRAELTESSVGLLNIKLTELAVITEGDHWPDNSRQIAEQAVDIVLAGFPNPQNSDVVAVELSILLGDDQYVQKLNAEFRTIDRATNVLSFPQLDEESQIDDFPDDQPIHLGDVLLAYETIKREAEEQGKDFMQHFQHLVIHGVLHLLGFDHEDGEQALIMENIEINLLKQLNHPNPYED